MRGPVLWWAAALFAVASVHAAVSVAFDIAVNGRAEHPWLVVSLVPLSAATQVAIMALWSTYERRAGRLDPVDRGPAGPRLTPREWVRGPWRLRWWGQAAGFVLGCVAFSSLLVGFLHYMDHDARRIAALPVMRATVVSAGSAAGDAGTTYDLEITDPAGPEFRSSFTREERLAVGQTVEVYVDVANRDHVYPLSAGEPVRQGPLEFGTYWRGAGAGTVGLTLVGLTALRRGRDPETPFS
jgi:hypothetical protein